MGEIKVYLVIVTPDLGFLTKVGKVEFPSIIYAQRCITVPIGTRHYPKFNSFVCTDEIIDQLENMDDKISLFFSDNNVELNVVKHFLLPIMYDNSNTGTAITPACAKIIYKQKFSKRSILRFYAKT